MVIHHPRQRVALYDARFSVLDVATIHIALTKHQGQWFAARRERHPKGMNDHAKEGALTAIVAAALPTAWLDVMTFGATDTHWTITLDRAEVVVVAPLEQRTALAAGAVLWVSQAPHVTRVDVQPAATVPTP